MVKTKMKTVLTILLILLFAFSSTQSAHGAEPKADAESPQGKVVLKWLGNAGWEIRIGKTTVLINPAKFGLGQQHSHHGV
jgi:hypothetical protein